MGSRADDKLREIEALRSSLQSKLGELESRFPFAAMGKKAVAAVAGTSAAAPLLAVLFRRFRGGKKKKKKDKAPSVQSVPTTVTVNVMPKGAAYIAAAGFAAWAGYKIYEAVQKSRASGHDDVVRGAYEPPSRPTVVTPIEQSRQSAGN